ncbi:hypothetical protein [Rhodococcus aetherivorans]|uniref:hypothetical protein n=1 Tax=Rhodococcus aetherivorans TaxID=191292 RepID=UPI001E394932|nr:hypothetical protein [Rhodococcus aetherivorans]UGQ41221.1 hypothetical protein LRQ66_24425 [Rhodococcus aetherivorans]
MIIAALVVTFWLDLPNIAPVAGSAVAAALVLMLIDFYSTDQMDRQWKDDERLTRLAARADEQHALYLAGDSKGIYGEYPPADLSTALSNSLKDDQLQRKSK